LRAHGTTIAVVTDDEVLDAFRRIRCWQGGDQRAPHKPLLLLMALARLQHEEDPWLSFEEIEWPLADLLRDFGPPRKQQHPEYPFWRLQNDGIWTLANADELGAIVGPGGDISAARLRAAHARASLSPEIVAMLQTRPALVNRIVAMLLEETFPASIHEDVLDAVGLPWVVEVDRPLRVRDPRFRELVLRAYERRCAICGYDGRLASADLGLEAAHVKWHAAGGPDSVENGIALCVFHHKSFDRGAIGLDDDWRVLVSQDVNGQSHVDTLFLRYVGQPMRRPQQGHLLPAAPFVAWHRKEVFRAPPRHG
jgi:putative restriction endonuclease